METSVVARLAAAVASAQTASAVTAVIGAAKKACDRVGAALALASVVAEKAMPYVVASSAVVAAGPVSS